MRTLIEIRNNSLSDAVLRDLTNAYIPSSATVEVSDSNTFDKIKSSVDLYNAISSDDLVLVVDSVELSKELSLLWMERPSIVASWIVKDTVVFAASPYEATIREYIEADADTGGTININLPDATLYKGCEVKVKRLGNLDTVTINAFMGQFIEGNAKLDILIANQCFLLTSNGVNWSITGSWLIL